MKSIRFSRSIPVAGVLALCMTAFAADPASLPRSGPASAAAPASVTLHFAGAQRIMQEGAGGLRIIRADGTVEHYRPDLFQVVDGKRREVRFTFHFVDGDHVQLNAVHADPSAPLELAPLRAKPTNS